MNSKITRRVPGVIVALAGFGLAAAASAADVQSQARSVLLGGQTYQSKSLGTPAVGRFAAARRIDVQRQAARILTSDPVHNTGAPVAIREAGLQRPTSQGQRGDAQSRAQRILLSVMGE